MQPQQPYYTPPPPQHDPYAFFLGQDQQKRTPKLPGAHLGAPKIVVYAIGGLLGIMALLFVFVTLFAHNKVDTALLIGIAQTQQELVRVAEIGITDGSDGAIKNFAVTTQFGITSDEQAMIAYIDTVGKKPAPKVLSLKKNLQTDAQLTSAKQTTTFDTVFVELNQSQLTKYQTALKQAYASAKGTKLKQLLQAQYDHSTLLLDQVKAIDT